MQQLTAKPSIAVVGAGPAGSLASLYLAQHGANVHVFERSSPDKAGLGAKLSVGPKSYNLLLSRRAWEAMEGAGVELPNDSYIQLESTKRYRTGDKQLSGMPAGPWARTINRGSLAGCLIDACQVHSKQAEASSGSSSTAAGTITFTFNSALSAVDFQSQEASFVDQTSGQTTTVKYDLLVGADGARSKVRDFLASSSQQAAAVAPGEGPLTFTQREDEMEYKTFEVPDVENMAMPIKRDQWLTLMDHSRNHSVIGSCSVDGVYRAVYITPAGEHATYKTLEGYVQVISSSFPVFSKTQIESIATQMLAGPVSGRALNTRCSRLHGPATLLIGDAAHSMWASLGQGANAVLEDCGVLGTVLGPGPLTKEELSSLPARWTAARLADAHAAVDLTEGGFGGVKNRTMPVLYRLRLMSQMVLSKVLPFVPVPALMTLNDTLTPYSVVLKNKEREEAAANVVLGVAAAAAVVGLAQLARHA